MKILWSLLALLLWIGCTPETNGSQLDPKPFLFDPDPIPVEVPFRIWMKSHFHRSDPFRFWIETKEPIFLQFQIFPCQEGPFNPGIKKRVAQHQQFFSTGRQSVLLEPSFQEGAYLLKVMNWDWLCYIPFSYSSAQPYWYSQEAKTQVVFFPEPVSSQISFKNKKGTLVSGSIQTNQPLYLSDPPCYLDLGVLPKLPNLEPLPPKKSLSTSPLLWQLTQPGIRYQSLLAP